MVKFIITILIFLSFGASAQDLFKFSTVDSLSYQYYLKGDWTKLISLGEKAIDHNIDYKRLRQRIGYSYFKTGDYFASEKNYEKALAFDQYDTDTQTMLYYCGINTGDEAYARFYADKLPADLKKSLIIEKFKPVDAIDFEYNYKANNSNTRSDPTYIRAGLSTQLGYRLKLYQSVSNYQQKIGTGLTKQPEYFALLSWTATPKIGLDVAYHFMNTKNAGVTYPGNLAFASLSVRQDRFSFGINASALNDPTDNYMQFGGLAGVTLPGKYSINLKSSLNGMVSSTNSRIIFSQVVGAHIAKNLWAEGNVTLGNLKNYNDHSALYVYNSIDPTTFRSGLTLFWQLDKKLTIFGNYTYEKKQIEITNTNYKQNSFSGGIIWKL
ncbi:MAG: hypothetical protein WCL21_13075 [Mariniphaga sp.]